MIIEYNIKRIKKTVSDFANLTGLNIAVMDNQFNLIATFEQNSPVFCKTIQQTKNGYTLCEKSDLEMLTRCRDTKKAVTHICHAGITDTVMPLIKNGILVGYIVIGRNRANASFETVWEKVSWINLDKEIIKSQYLKIASYNMSQIRSLINLICEILIENSIELNIPKVLTDAAIYIENNLSDDISIQSICKYVHVSKNALYKLFNEIYGCTVNDFVIWHRVEKAKNLLTNSFKPIWEIGEDVGAPNPAHFCRMFKKSTGLSPSEFRKRTKINI